MVTSRLSRRVLEYRLASGRTTRAPPLNTCHAIATEYPGFFLLPCANPSSQAKCFCRRLRLRLTPRRLGACALRARAPSTSPPLLAFPSRSPSPFLCLSAGSPQYALFHLPIADLVARWTRRHPDSDASSPGPNTWPSSTSDCSPGHHRSS